MNVLIEILLIDECPHDCTKSADSMRIFFKKYMHIYVSTLKSTTKKQQHKNTTKNKISSYLHKPIYEETFFSVHYIHFLK